MENPKNLQVRVELELKPSTLFKLNWTKFPPSKRMTNKKKTKMRQKRSQKAKDHQNIRHSLGIPSFTWSNGRSPILNTEGVLFLLRKLLPFMEVSKITTATTATAAVTAAARAKIPRFKQSS